MIRPQEEGSGPSRPKGELRYRHRSSASARGLWRLYARIRHMIDRLPAAHRSSETLFLGSLCFFYLAGRLIRAAAALRVGIIEIAKTVRSRQPIKNVTSGVHSDHGRGEFS